MLIEDALQQMTCDYINPKSERYYNADGIPVPRVTEILSSMMHSDALMYWANNLGFRGIKYAKALNDAARTGTIAHNTIENFLRNKIDPGDTDNPSFKAFLAWYQLVISHGNTFSVIAMEQKLACQWFGGTYDLLCRINGRFFLVEFKTSNHVTEKYFLQLAAYVYMLRQIGQSVDGVIVLQLSKETEEFNEYILDYQIPEHAAFMDQCTVTFLALVYAWYNVQAARRQFREVF